MAPKIRLHVAEPLQAGQTLPLSQGQASYLVSVMRLGPGARILAFNGQDGEWEAEVIPEGRRGASLRPLTLVRAPVPPPDLWLLFAPIRKARLEILVEKAVELGAARLMPVATDYTQGERLRLDRLEALVTEAAEQCGATVLPAIADPRPLVAVLADWPEGRDLWFCDERLAGQGAAPAPTDPGPGAILIGPEGGFSPPEVQRLRAHPAVRPISLGPRILRAETAAIAALVLWQDRRGDWR